MQTFLPYDNFDRSAAALDNKRLKNQVKEAAQIFASLRDGAFVQVGDELVKYSTGGYPNHPATRMWEFHQGALARYALACVAEMRRRGQQGMKVYEAMFTKVAELLPNETPIWFGVPEFHASHRSQLLAKDPTHYGQFGWSEQPGALAYVWP